MQAGVSRAFRPDIVTAMYGQPEQPADGPLAAYRERVSSGVLRPDPCQRLAAERLQALHMALRGYRPRQPSRGFFYTWRDYLGLGNRSPADIDRPAGLYIFGGVGGGKSMLMDLFFATAPVTAKRRVHFHAFMQEVHDFLHRHSRGGRNGKPEGVDKALDTFADKLMGEATVLCFDELYVNDVADAMLLSRLFTALLDRGIIMVITSNFAPQELYPNGLQRDRFLPFIDLLNERLDVVAIDSGIDHRMQRLQGKARYHYPNDASAHRALAQAFAELTDGAEGAPCDIAVKGRHIKVPRAARHAAWFGYDDLVAQDPGPADMLTIATHFSAVLLEGVPALAADQRDAARRLITLIDALYEHRTKLVIGADAPPEGLYPPDGPLANEFARLQSRLAEMTSDAYWQRPHLT